MSRATRIAGCIIAAGLLLGGFVRSGQAQDSPDRRVEGVEFQGNRTFSDDELSRAILTSETTCRSVLFQTLLPVCHFADWGFAHDRYYLDESELPADLLRLRLFYRLRGFREVEVDTVLNRDDGTVRIRFDIDEGMPVRLGSFEIEGSVPAVEPDEVRDRFPLAVGDRFNLVALNRGKQDLEERLRDRGYLTAAVLDEHFLPAGSREVALTLRVRPGPRARIGTVSVEGAEEIGGDVVGRFLTFAPGQYYTGDRIQESQRALYNLEAIRFANLRTQLREDTDTLVDMTVDLGLAPERSLRTGAGITNTTCARGEAQFTHRNFLGGARRLRISGRLSNLLAADLAGDFPCLGVSDDPVFQDVGFRLRADFQQPYFVSARHQLEGGLFLERETVPGLFVRDSRGGEVAITRQLRPRMPLTLAFRPEFTGFEAQSADVFFCVNFGFCQPRDIELITQSRWLSPALLTWRAERTNAPFSPTEGYYLQLELEGAPQATGSEYRYYRFVVDAANFDEVASGLVVASRIRSGFVEPTGGPVPEGSEEGGMQPDRGTVVHPRKRFFGGGPQSVRGFGQNLLGPTVLVVDSAASCPDMSVDSCVRDLLAEDPGQLRERPVGGNASLEVNLELRADLGGRWDLVGFLDAGQIWEDITSLEVPVATPGLGVRYSSPVGPLRLDVGYNPSGVRSRPVVTELPGGEIRALEESFAYDPFTFDDPGVLREFFRRLQLHLSIGEAF